MKLKKLIEQLEYLDDTNFKLPKLKYGIQSLRPIKSLDVHYNKHHGGYVKKLNENIRDTKYEGQPLSSIIVRSYADKQWNVFNNAAQHFNHSFFWELLSPKGGGKPKGGCLDCIEKNFGSFDTFKKEVIHWGSEHFGSGWVWVVKDGSQLVIQDMHDADTPIMMGTYPVMVIDLWEHAYYLDYKNDRKKYLTEIFNIIDWDVVSQNMREVQ